MWWKKRYSMNIIQRSTVHQKNLYQWNEHALQRGAWDLWGRVNKIALSPFDSKWYIAQNGIDTFAYGYRLTDEELHEYVMELLKEEQIGRHNQQQVTDKASFGPILQIIQYRFKRFGDRFFNVVHVEWPNRISCMFVPAFQLNRLVR